jgi:acetoin utilization deacetylase AcuC-like enzyme
VAFLYDPACLAHEPPAGHPERPERLQSILSLLSSHPLNEKLKRFEPRSRPVFWLTTVHGEDYIETLRQTEGKPLRLLDHGDTYAGPHSFAAACAAVGCALFGVDLLYRGEARHAFCAVRPPGHHARPSAAMGFCLLNTVAIAARYAQRNYGIARVAILDWDVHHGNGTQEIFYEDPTVFYVSLHQYPHYPGTGAASETGRGPGLGYTLNLPMPAGSTEEDYAQAMEERVLPALLSFQPDLLILSAGFDTHKDDPLGSILLTEESFARLTRYSLQVVAKGAALGILSVLEGGYNTAALARSVLFHLEALHEAPR